MPRGALLAVRLGDVHPARGQRPVAARLHRGPQLADPLVESFLVLAPPHPINAGRRVALQLHEAVSQQLGRDVMQQRREPYLLARGLGGSGCFTYTVEPHRRAGPALSPGRGRRFSVALGCSPSLRTLRMRRFGGGAIVRVVHRYYASIRLLAGVNVGRTATGLPRPARRQLRGGHRRDLTVPVRRASAHAQGLRPRGARRGLARSALADVAFRFA